MVNLLVHLILGDEVADVVGGLTELPLVHACSVRGQSVGGVPGLGLTLGSVPVEESSPPVHGDKLVQDSAEQSLH